MYIAVKEARTRMEQDIKVNLQQAADSKYGANVKHDSLDQHF